MKMNEYRCITHPQSLEKLLGKHAYLLSYLEAHRQHFIIALYIKRVRQVKVDVSPYMSPSFNFDPVSGRELINGLSIITDTELNFPLYQPNHVRENVMWDIDDTGRGGSVRAARFKYRYTWSM